MVVSMVADPPERSILACKHAKESEDELELAAGLERSVSQQSVITRRYAE